MFRPRPDATAPTIQLEVEGRVVAVPIDTTAAAAVLLAGFDDIRESAISGARRGPYCMMGVCFDCLVEIDGVPNRQGCMVTVEAGMRIRRQRGPRALSLTEPEPNPHHEGGG
ncbi:MAG: (2Fe-2S)-binding protein [Alphaproteobacteria bacterium]|nr:(2Fe-2S)-binding protein [Alphaproteobacteria bacterium]